MKKIMFSEEYGLEQAVLKNLESNANTWEMKNMTRRVCSSMIQDFLNKNKNGITVVPLELIPADMTVEEFYERWIRDKKMLFVDNKENGKGCRVIDMISVALKYSPYQVGEEVAIAQCYDKVLTDMINKNGCFDSEKYSAFKKFSEEKPYGIWDKGISISNKMFVRADLMPHRIKITNVKAERLQDINEEDCLREGIVKAAMLGDYLNGANQVDTKYYYTYKGVKVYFDTAREAFASLINGTSHKKIWEKNPWVWVYEFVVI